QEDAQMQATLGAAALYGSQPARVPAAAPSTEAISVSPTAPARAEARGAIEDRSLGLGERIVRKLGAWYEVARPFSFTASTAPVAAAGALAAFNRDFSWPLFLAALAGGVLLH